MECSTAYVCLLEETVQHELILITDARRKLLGGLRSCLEVLLEAHACNALSRQKIRALKWDSSSDPSGPNPCDFLL